MPKLRKPQARQVLPVMHIFCEGEKTEPNYINGYLASHWAGQRRTHVVRIESTRKNTPVQLVEEAIAAKFSGNYPEGDQYWVVYDREGSDQYHLHHDVARNKANAHGIHIALSSVCFEVWLLLHFQDQVLAYANFADLNHRSRLHGWFQRLGLKYEKGSTAIFWAIRPYIAMARLRARELNRASLAAASPGHCLPHHLNPYTDVYCLLDAIDAFYESPVEGWREGLQGPTVLNTAWQTKRAAQGDAAAYDDVCHVRHPQSCA